MQSDTLADADRHIPTALQRDSSLSIQALANIAQMSTSPCWRRTKGLCEAAVIRGEVALVDRRKIGMGTPARIHLSLVDHSEPAIRCLKGFAQHHDRVVECVTITLAHDYVIRVVVPDLIRASTRHCVLRQTKDATAVPLD